MAHPATYFKRTSSSELLSSWKPALLQFYPKLGRHFISLNLLWKHFQSAGISLPTLTTQYCKTLRGAAVLLVEFCFPCSGEVFLWTKPFYKHKWLAVVDRHRASPFQPLNAIHVRRLFAQLLRKHHASSPNSTHLISLAEGFLTVEFFGATSVWTSA